jgi:hypothetical protein
VYTDLLSQAEQLATIDARKPKQVNLRRAVSAAYYAVFHYLVHEACSLQIGTKHGQAVYRQTLGRAYTHTVMKQCCMSFGGGTLKESVRRALPVDAHGSYAILAEIKNIASLFCDLQDLRHLADYDLTARFSRFDVLTLIEQANSHIERFSGLPSSDDKSFFLACLWAWKELTNR